jgi:hypothetical protein
MGSDILHLPKDISKLVLEKHRGIVEGTSNSFDSLATTDILQGKEGSETRRQWLLPRLILEAIGKFLERNDTLLDNRCCCGILIYDLLCDGHFSKILPLKKLARKRANLGLLEE